MSAPRISQISLATENPTHNKWLISLLSQIHPLSTSYPILINSSPVPHENSSSICTGMAHQESFLTIRLFVTSPVPLLIERNQALDLPLAIASTLTDPTMMIFYAFCRICLFSPLGPLSHSPTKNFIPPLHRLKVATSIQAQSPSSFSSSLKMGRSIPTHALLANTAPPLMKSPSHCMHPVGTETISLQVAPTDITVAPTLTDTHFSLLPHSQNLNQQIPSTNTNTFTNMQETYLRKKKEKLEQRPTRRSQRIKDKHNKSLNISQKLADRKPRKKKPTLPFQAIPTSLPLDTSKALSILQATGLLIDKHVEEMIEEVLKQNQDQGKSNSTPPTTPLHDLVPPMTVPHFDLPL